MILPVGANRTNPPTGNISAVLIERHKCRRMLFLVMERKDVSDLFRALLPVGTVEAVRQEYQVFKTVSGDYLVFSPSSRGSASFHMTVVAAEKVEAVAKVMGKGGATTGSLMKEEKLEESFGSDDKIAKRFDLLMALYILAAMGRVEMQKEGRNLVFTKRPEKD
jgi:hypothetical protein